MQQPSLCDLTSRPLYALVINNISNDTDRDRNGSLITKTLSQHKDYKVTEVCNLNARGLKSVTNEFINQIREATKQHGPVVTLFYFSGYGTRREEDTDQAILCGTDYERSFKSDAFRILPDYMLPLSAIEGMHMLLLDCASLAGEFHFVMPSLPPRFHTLYANSSHLGDKTSLISPMTQKWCELAHAGYSVEELSKRVRIALVSLPVPLQVYECSTLHNHFVFQ